MAAKDDGLVEEYQRRTRQLEALYDTAGDLSSLHDVDEVLAAIVRRGRQLLGSDVAYLMLLDEEREVAYMRVGEGIQTQEFLDIQLAIGEGIAGLVAATRMPLWTADYASDPHLAVSIDDVVRKESLVAIVGVPLASGDRVLGVLLASDRRPREFTHDEVKMLSSLAHHAAIALENASLLEDSQRALSKWQEASTRVEQQNRDLQRAADMHERLTALVLEGASVSEVADAVASVVGGLVAVLDATGTPLTSTVVTPPVDKVDLERATVNGGRVHRVSRGEEVLHVVAVQAGTRRLGFLAHQGGDLTGVDVRALERSAMVTALLLLDRRSHEEARARASSDLMLELMTRREADLDRFSRRARSAGVRLPAPPFVMAVALAPPDVDLEAFSGAVARLAARESWLARVDGRQGHVVVRSSDPAAAGVELARQLSDEVGQPVTVGAVGPRDTLGAVQEALGRALTCAKVLETTGRAGTGATPEDLGVYALLLSDVSRDRIEEFVRDSIGPVQEWDSTRKGQLMATLQAYFDEGGQSRRLAEVLFVHVNTLYQRLDRIDRLLGPGWRRGEQSLQVHLAVRLARLMDSYV